MSATHSILKVIRDAEDDEPIQISVDLVLTVEQFRKAVAWGRMKKWTHEQDGEWAALVFGAIMDGAGIEFDVDDSRVTDGPDGLFADGETK